MVDVAGKKLKLAIWDTGTARHGLSLPTLAAATAEYPALAQVPVRTGPLIASLDAMDKITDLFVVH
jgi:hypothetical protein